MGVPSSFAVWENNEEDFMEGVSIFSDCKLRAGMGTNRNPGIPGKITKFPFVSNSSNVSYTHRSEWSYPCGIQYTRFAMPDIQLEVSTETNVGC